MSSRIASQGTVAPCDGQCTSCTGTPRATALDDLEAQPALADPRLADHPHDLAVRRDRAREDPVEPGQLRFPADQAGEAPERRAVQARAARPDPAKLEGPDLGAHALHAPRADIGERE